MDQTTVFRGWVKTVRFRKGGKGGVEEEEHRPAKTQLSCPFSSKARDIVQNITQLRDFLFKNRSDYINLNHLWTGSSRMSDLERDQIDSEAETVIKTCKQLINHLSSSATNVTLQYSQLRRHREAVLDVLESYLKGVCRVYSEQRAVRVKKTSEMKRLSRLESLVRAGSTTWKPTGRVKARDNISNQGQHNSLAGSSSLLESEQNSKLLKLNDSDTAKYNSSSETEQYEHPVQDVTNVDRIGIGLRKRDPKHTTSTHSVVGVESAELLRRREAVMLEEAEKWSRGEEGEGEVVGEEQLSKENDHLYLKMNSLVNELEQIEGKVVEIGRLQQVFTDNVLQQEGDIFRINEVAIHSTENIKAGNEQIRQAMKRKSNWRVYILFFLIVMSFTLLFLDWYNA